MSTIKLRDNEWDGHIQGIQITWSSRAKSLLECEFENDLKALCERRTFECVRRLGDRNHFDTVFSDEWEIERIVNKRIRRTKGGKHATEYLMRWTGYGPEYDQWYKEKDLSNAGALPPGY
jgi:hypothetical protein